ncbi:MAG: rRNA adenine dimethyltransferase family protein, partial [Patescibacteria group bacterium]
TVLEVGPGEGVLTELLLQKAREVIAVEKDDRLIPVLEQKFAKEIVSGRLELLHADILLLDLRLKIKDLSNYKIVANIPYYITGALIRKFLQETDCPPETMVLLLQKEVAKRIVASDKKESILSISVKAYGTPKYIDTVKAGAFSPPPNVDSAIIAIEGISKEFFASRKVQPPETSFRLNLKENEGRFFALLKKGFAHPRKLLSSNLGVPTGKLKECGIAEKARPENLSLEDWKCLSVSLSD